MSLPLFHCPGTIAFLDDDPDYLEMLALVVPPQWNVRLFSRASDCIVQLQIKMNCFLAAIGSCIEHLPCMLDPVISQNPRCWRWTYVPLPQPSPLCPQTEAIPQTKPTMCAWSGLKTRPVFTSPVAFFSPTIPFATSTFNKKTKKKKRATHHCHLRRSPSPQTSADAMGRLSRISHNFLAWGKIMEWQRLSAVGMCMDVSDTTLLPLQSSPHPPVVPQL